MVTANKLTCHLLDWIPGDLIYLPEKSLDEREFETQRPQDVVHLRKPQGAKAQISKSDSFDSGSDFDEEEEEDHSPEYPELVLDEYQKEFFPQNPRLDPYREKSADDPPSFERFFGASQPVFRVLRRLVGKEGAWKGDYIVELEVSLLLVKDCTVKGSVFGDRI